MSILAFVLVTLAAHVLGDYVLQRVLNKTVPNKRKSKLGMLIHSVYADALCGLVVGIATHHIAASVVLCVLAHYVVDSIMPKRKNIVASLFDQAVHITCIAIIYYLGGI